jgi:flavodoxin
MQEASLQKGEGKTAIVVFHTQFGNTEKVARALASGLAQAGVKASCVSIAEVQPESLKNFDLIAIGAPTQAFTATKPMKEFIQKLEGIDGLAGRNFCAFDTKLPSRFSGSAAKYIESRLEGMKLKIAAPRSSAIGRGSEFKLDEGEEKRFEQIGLELGKSMMKSGQALP